MDGSSRAYRPLELRSSGRKLSGVVLRYGDHSADFNERFSAGALRPANHDIPLNIEHDAFSAISWSGSGGLELEFGEHEVGLRATLPTIPAALAAAEGIRTGLYRGLSIEFRAIRERIEGGIRVIEDAILEGVALVRAPAYPASGIELRKQAVKVHQHLKRTWGRWRIPMDGRARLCCECGRKPLRTPKDAPPLPKDVQLMLKAFEDRARAAIAAAKARKPGKDIIVTSGGYAEAVGSLRKGTLDVAVKRDEIVFGLTGPPIPFAANLFLLAQTTEIYARPIISESSPREVVEHEDGKGPVVRFLDGSEIEGVLLKPSAADLSGWDLLEIVDPAGTDELDPVGDDESDDDAADRRSAMRRLGLGL